MSNLIKGYFKHILGSFERKYHLSRLGGSSQNSILVYHSVGKPGSNDLPGHICETTFKKQITEIESRYEIVDLPQIYCNSSEKKKVALTFDDGYLNFYETVFPILKERGLPATVYVNPDFIGDHKRESLVNKLNISTIGHRLIMNENEISELVDSDLITVGNHTLTHPDLSSPEINSKSEIVQGKEKLRDMFGIEADRFCYPYGSFDKDSKEIVAETHQNGVSLEFGLVTNPVDEHLLPRINTNHSPGILLWLISDIHHSIIPVISFSFDN